MQTAAERETWDFKEKVQNKGTVTAALPAHFDKVLLFRGGQKPCLSACAIDDSLIQCIRPSRRITVLYNKEKSRFNTFNYRNKD